MSFKEPESPTSLRSGRSDNTSAMKRKGGKMQDLEKVLDLNSIVPK